MASTPARGMMIVLEGLDRSGKTTQAQKLLGYFQSRGKSARVQRFPDRSEPMSGPVIDAFLKNAQSVGESREAIHLIFAANRWLLAQKIREELAKGVNLILDRYSFSGVAYSMAKGLDKRWACQPEVGLPKPDLVLFFEATPDQVQNRAGFGDEVLERSDFQRLVYANMQSLMDHTYWRIINAAEPIDIVQTSITSVVDRMFGEHPMRTEIGNFSLADFGVQEMLKS